MAQPRSDDQPDALNVNEGRGVERERISPPADRDQATDRSDARKPANQGAGQDIDKDNGNDVDPDSPHSDVDRDDSVTD